MTGGNNIKDDARYLVVSDVHDTLKKYEDSDERYLPKHSSIANLAQSQGAEFIALNGDLFDEDSTVHYILRDVDERIDSFVERRISHREAKLSQIAMYVMYIGGRDGIKGLEAKAALAEGRRKRELEDLIKKYKSYGQEEMAAAIKKSDDLKKKILPILKDEIKEIKNKIEVYYEDNYIPAMKEAYSGYSGKVLVTQGNHDPDKIRKLDGEDNFVFIDQLDKPYVHGPLKIGAASNIEKHNLFPKTANFEIPELYKGCEFDVLPSDIMKEMKKFEEENKDELKKLPFLERRQKIFEKQQEILSRSKVLSRLNSPEFEDMNVLFTHAGPSLEGWNELNTHVKKDEQNGKKPILDENKNFQFEEPLGESGIGLEQVIDQKINEDKLDMIFSGHVHEKLSPSRISPLSHDANKKIFAGRTDPNTVFLCYAQKNEDGKVDLKKYREFKFKQDKKAA